MKQFYGEIPAEILNLTDRESVRKYAGAAALPAEAIVGLTPAQLRGEPIAGTWSIQRIVAHLMDSDLIGSYRMKRIIAEDRPRLDAYDHNAFADRLFYDRLDAASVCEMFRLNRILTAEILDNLSDDAFDRVALHPDMGELTLGTLLHVYAYHVHHHLSFIATKKRMILDKGAPEGSPA